MSESMKNTIHIQFKLYAIKLDKDKLTLEQLHMHQLFVPVGGANVHMLSQKHNIYSKDLE